MASKSIILFLEHEGFSPKALVKLRRAFNVAYCGIEDLYKYDGKNNVVGIFVRLRSYIDDIVLNYFPNLEFIISPTTGHNHLDLDAIKRRDIRIVSLKGETVFLGSVTATAEFTWGLILSLTRRIPEALSHVALGGWNRDAFRGLDLSGRTLGIVGYGRLGQIIEEYAHAFRMNILINDIAQRDPVFGKVVAFEGLLAESDIVTVHVDVNPSSVNMFGDAEFGRMKRTAFFVNTSRGELVDEMALCRALKENKIAGAAVDVLSYEQKNKNSSALLKYSKNPVSKIIISPHIGGATFDSMHKTEEFLINKLLG